MLSGHTDYLPVLHSALLTNAITKSHERLEFVRGRAWRVPDNLLVEPHRHRGSHMLTSLAAANCLIHFPQASNRLAAGTNVDIEFLRW